MPDNATVYAPIHFFPSQEQFSELLPEAKVEVDEDAEVATLGFPGLTVTVNRMSDQEMGEHLSGFVGYVRAKGGSPALEIRVLSTLSVFGMVFEPGFDEAENWLEVLGAMTGATDGLCFLGGEVRDATGRGLLLGEEAGMPSPPPERVARRALVLLGLAVRGLLEQDAGGPDESEAESMRAEVVDRLGKTSGVLEEAEDPEREFLGTPIGGAETQDVINGVWRAEGVQVLLWALGVRDLPPHDAQEHPYELAKDLGLLGEGKVGLVDSPRLRPPEEIEWMWRRLQGLHWRMREHRVRGEPVDLVAFAAENFYGGFDLEGIPLEGGDLTVGGSSLAEADPEQVQLTMSTALERHHAANWLLGCHPVYTRVDTPT